MLSTEKKNTNTHSNDKSQIQATPARLFRYKKKLDNKYKKREEDSDKHKTVRTTKRQNTDFQVQGPSEKKGVR